MINRSVIMLWAVLCLLCHKIGAQRHRACTIWLIFMQNGNCELHINVATVRGDLTFRSQKVYLGVYSGSWDRKLGLFWYTCRWIRSADITWCPCNVVNNRMIAMWWDRCSASPRLHNLVVFNAWTVLWTSELQNNGCTSEIEVLRNLNNLSWHGIHRCWEVWTVLL